MVRANGAGSANDVVAPCIARKGEQPPDLASKETSLMAKKKATRKKAKKKATRKKAKKKATRKKA